MDLSKVAVHSGRVHLPGPKVVRRGSGSHAVPLWPPRRRRLILVRDFWVVAVHRVDGVSGERKQVERADKARGGGADGVKDGRVGEVAVRRRESEAREEASLVEQGCCEGNVGEKGFDTVGRHEMISFASPGGRALVAGVGLTCAAVVRGREDGAASWMEYEAER